MYENRNSSTYLHRLSGTEFPDRIISPSNTFYLRFESDGSVSSSGFTGTVRGSTQPFITTLTGNHGIITTPEFPELYRNNASVGWQINVDRGAVTLTFTEFDIQPGTTNSTCDKDKLVVSNVMGYVSV